MPITVFLADDNLIVREGARALLELYTYLLKDCAKEVEPANVKRRDALVQAFKVCA